MEQSRNNLQLDLLESFLLLYLYLWLLTASLHPPSQDVCPDFHPNISSLCSTKNLGNIEVHQASSSTKQTGMCNNDFCYICICIGVTEEEFYLSHDCRRYFCEAKICIGNITAINLPQTNAKAIYIAFSVVGLAIKNLNMIDDVMSVYII